MSNQAHNADDLTRECSTKSRDQIESFIEDVLRKNLKEYESFIVKTNAEIGEFHQLRHFCEKIINEKLSEFKTQVDIGSNFFMAAKVPDTTKIMVNVGLNHYVEFTMDETIEFCDFKVRSLQNESDVIREKSIETRAQIKLALLCLAEREHPMKNVDGVAS